MRGVAGAIMADWSSGYVVDIEYTHGFYQELTPSLLGFFALLQGIQAPGLGVEPLTYCELGCGQGFSTNLLAAANPHIQFYATDFNPSHAAGARALARSARLNNVHFSDDSFAEYLTREDLPDFDFITLHGIYSWISAENRQAIVRFIRQRLKPGGLVYMSYNAMPGWASIMPLRRLLVEHAATQGSSRALQSRISASLEFASRLGSLDARYFASNPKVAPRLERMRKQNRNYVAHEYFNRDLTPFYFMDVAQELSEAKLTWVGPANALETLDAIHLTKEQQQFLAEIDDTALRQMVRDHMIDQQFRRDIFIKGPLPFAKGLAKEKWLDTRFVLLRKSGDIPRQVQGLRCKIGLAAELYDPLIAALEGGPRPLREIMADPALAKFDFQRVSKAITLLVAQGTCQPCLPEQGLAERQLQAERFNEAVAEHARHAGQLSHFASAVTGGAIPADRVSQLIWLALRSEEKDVPQFVWDALSNTGHKLVKDGRTLTTGEENLAELRQRFAQFEESSIPVWRTVGLGAELSAHKTSEKRRSTA